MSGLEKGKQKLWQVRRKGAVQGPFPSGTLRRFLLVGRISLDDEVSCRHDHWQPVRDVPEVIPPEVRKALAGGDPDAVLPSRLREDERNGRDRRRDQAEKDVWLRRREERRRQEPQIMQRHRLARTMLLEAGRRTGIPLSGILVIGLIFVLSTGFGIYLGAPPMIPDPDCSAPPQAWVNWRNCRLDNLWAESKDLEDALLNNASLRGARLSGSHLNRTDLQYADLSGADLSHVELKYAKMKGVGLRNADLSYADLSGSDLSFADLGGANLGSAVLDGARLDNAIWVDGGRCAAGSVGGCVPVQAISSSEKDSVSYR